MAMLISMSLLVVLVESQVKAPSKPKYKYTIYPLNQNGLPGNRKLTVRLNMHNITVITDLITAVECTVPLNRCTTPSYRCHSHTVNRCTVPANKCRTVYSICTHLEKIFLEA